MKLLPPHEPSKVLSFNGIISIDFKTGDLCINTINGWKFITFQLEHIEIKTKEFK